jgi:hypothetical protein
VSNFTTANAVGTLPSIQSFALEPSQENLSLSPSTKAKVALPLKTHTRQIITSTVALPTFSCDSFHAHCWRLLILRNLKKTKKTPALEPEAMDGFKKCMQNHQIQGGISLGIISFNPIAPNHKRGEGEGGGGCTG